VARSIARKIVDTHYRVPEDANITQDWVDGRGRLEKSSTSTSVP
jgi:hypothetical protein